MNDSIVDEYLKKYSKIDILKINNKLSNLLISEIINKFSLNKVHAQIIQLKKPEVISKRNIAFDCYKSKDLYEITISQNNYLKNLLESSNLTGFLTIWNEINRDLQITLINTKCEEKIDFIMKIYFEEFNINKIVEVNKFLISAINNIVLKLELNNYQIIPESVYIDYKKLSKKYFLLKDKAIELELVNNKNLLIFDISKDDHIIANLYTNHFCENLALNLINYELIELKTNNNIGKIGWSIYVSINLSKLIVYVLKLLDIKECITY